jgi:hypothetical protein
LVLGTGSMETTGATRPVLGVLGVLEVAEVAADVSEAVSTIFAEYAWGRPLGSAARAEGAVPVRLVSPMKPVSEPTSRADENDRRVGDG